MMKRQDRFKGKHRPKCDLPMCERKTINQARFCNYHINRIKWLNKGDLIVEVEEKKC